MKKSVRLAVWLLLIAAAIAALIYFARQKPEPGPPRSKLVIRFLEVGQGDCELLQLPDGQTILIDSGDRGAPTVDLLRTYGIREIDLAIATHPHSDHIGEMRDVMRAFRVKEFWDSGFPHPTKVYEDVLTEIRDQAILFNLPKRGETRAFGPVSVEVVHPRAEFPDQEPNNASVVIRVVYGNRRFLFTGDAELPKSSSDASAWQEMLEGGADKLQADLLKAAHHGSSNGTNQAVLDAVRPTIVTVSCRTGNDYHHPHASFVQLLASRRDSIALHRTDLEGTITAECDGESLEVQTEKQVAASELYKTGDEVAGRSETNSNARGGARRSR
jgi:beta-lactamase superfamily II metal-dependent hydrolase